MVFGSTKVNIAPPWESAFSYKYHLSVVCFPKFSNSFLNMIDLKFPMPFIIGERNWNCLRESTVSFDRWCTAYLRRASRIKHSLNSMISLISELGNEFQRMFEKLLLSSKRWLYSEGIVCTLRKLAKMLEGNEQSLDHSHFYILRIPVKLTQAGISWST